MFDYYEPAGPLFCPKDGHPLVSWQGKDGPRALLVWRQGVARPSDHEMVAEESRLAETELERMRLPATFTIYSSDCPVHHPITAICSTVDGTWSTMEIRELGVYSRDDDELRRTLKTLAAVQGGERARYPKPREFVLIDLTTQMRFLPRFIRTWPWERLLAWLRVWGDVYEVRGRPDWPKDTYTFRSWVGRWTTFTVTDDGRLYSPGTSGWAWPDDAE